MPANKKNPQIEGQYFRWRMFQKNDVWYADGRLASQNLGKYSLHSRDYEEAKSNLRKLDLVKAIEHGLAKNASASCDRRLAINDGWRLHLEWCNRPEVMGGVSKKTLNKYRRSAELHQEFCEANKIRYWNDYDKQIHEAYGRELDAKYAQRSLYFELSQVKTVINWLVDEKHLPADVNFRFRLSKPDGSETYCYTKEQVQSMLTVCDGVQNLEWIENLIVVLACTGLRIGELSALRWTDIDFAGDAIRLTDERSSARRIEMGAARRTKGKRGRVIPLHPILKKRLKKFPRHAHGRVLCGPKGGVVNPDRSRERFVERIIQPLTAKFPTPAGEIGFEHARFHSFRHYFISQAFIAGATEAEIMEWVGHKDAKTVAIYRHLRMEDAQRRMQQIDFVDP